MCGAILVFKMQSTFAASFQGVFFVSLHLVYGNSYIDLQFVWGFFYYCTAFLSMNIQDCISNMSVLYICIKPLFSHKCISSQENL